MKKLITLTLIAICAVFFFQRLHAKEEDTSIIIIQPASNAETTFPNRAPALVPIIACYDGSISSIVITFISNIGIVESAILNTVTGEMIEGSIDAFGQPVIVGIQEPGHYILHFTLSNGTEYIGEFNLE